MDFMDPFPRPFRSTIAENSQTKAHDSKRDLDAAPAPWPLNESLETSTDGLTAPNWNGINRVPSQYARYGRNDFPNFMTQPRQVSSNDGPIKAAVPAFIGDPKSDRPSNRASNVPSTSTIDRAEEQVDPMEDTKSTNVLDLWAESPAHVGVSHPHPDPSTFFRVPEIVLGSSNYPNRLNPSNQPTKTQVRSTDSSCRANEHESTEPQLDPKRIFPCTFCNLTFKSKYDWSRHEKSLHLDLEAWKCAPESGTTPTGEKRCVYCLQLEPTRQHLDEHNHRACVGMDRTFNRKDHLVQHLRLVHRLADIPPLHEWRAQAPPFICRCGFCDQRLNSWGERVDHLAGHFRQGATMSDWEGGHEFTPAVAELVRNSS